MSIARQAWLQGLHVPKPAAIVLMAQERIDRDRPSTLDGHQHHEVEPGDSEARPCRGIESSHQLAVDVLGCQVFVG